MKNLVSFIFLLALLVSGCSEEEMLLNGTSASGEGRTFTTEFENKESRTYLENGLYARWTEGDRVSLFDATTLNRQYKFDGETGDNGGTFSMLGKPDGTGVPLRHCYAVYPYDEDVKVSQSGVITVTLPSEQSYAKNSYGLGDNTMVAVTHNIYDTFLKFKNVGSCFKLQLYGDDVTVKSITLTGNNYEMIAGKADITAEYDKAPVVTMTNDATTTITLDCGEEGVKIGSSAQEATAFWITLPSVTFERGITITVTDIHNRMFVQTTSKELVIERNKINPMEAVEVKPDIPYLTFVAGAAQRLTMTKAVETLEYSVNNGTWSELGTNTVDFGGELGILRLRGKNLNGTGETNSSYYSPNIEFENEDVCVACYGDIRTLLDYSTYTKVDTQNARFDILFSGCAQLTSAPQLPATTLADWCYSGMFSRCWRLKEAPELPATTLAFHCYSTMFSGCSGLVKAPELPATILAENCYSGMFGGCTSLKEAPALPAKTLAQGCYINMFNECKSLLSTPALPATTLARACYKSMFNECYSLIDVPEILPAETLTEACYDNMFKHCNSLTKAPKLPATTLAISCYHMMFSGCNSLAEAPKLPATILYTDCYNSMFSACYSLTEAPALPADSLVWGCYEGMFKHCNSLTKAPALPATIIAYACYSHMFDGCTNLVEAPAVLPATTLAAHCYSGMFQDCTSLTTAPVLPATKLEQYCYEVMFRRCEKLNSVTMLATDIGANYSLSGWLGDVSSTGTFTKAKEMESLPSNGSGIPEGWTVKNYGE